VPNDADMIPVALMAYARPRHLRRVLAGLRTERVPLIHAFADGAKGGGDADDVAEVRRLLKEIDWCEVRLVERAENVGLGRNVLAGVGEVARAHAAFVVWEDDLVGVPGTYAWLCAALRHYAEEPRVASVTAWTHPSVTPVAAAGVPYFDGRAECWVWGAYSRSWTGMDRTALEKMAAARTRGVAPDAYGADLPRMARTEQRRNIWAVRWLYHHLESGGLCLRPPWSMVDHIGFDGDATNAAEADRWSNSLLRPTPPIPTEWPEPAEQLECRELWRKANPPQSAGEYVKTRTISGGRRLAKWGRSALRDAVPEALRGRLRRRWGWQWFRGDYPGWPAARAASGGYADGAILERVLNATLAVQRGLAAFERDGVLFYEAELDAPLMQALDDVRRAVGGGLRVLDFGGSLGSTYWRLRGDLPAGSDLVWDVVEQSGFVEAGRTHLGGERPRFFHDVREAEATGPHDVVLCSGVLQYLEDPEGVLAEWRELRVPFLILNNLPLHAAGPDRLRVQHVPPSIYPASYPVRFFNRAGFIARLEADYEIVREYASEAVWPVDYGMYPSTGLLLKRKGLA